MPIAIRLYKDLISSQISVWRDQSDGDPTADFREEFLSRIDECDYFLMLDSKNYRNKSNWCCTEIERCFENQKKNNGKPRLIVCLLDQDGEWRQDYKDDRHRYIFEKVNTLKYNDLYFDKYDNDLHYYKTLKNICAIFNLEYKQWNDLPAIQDLEDELSDKGQDETPLSNDDYEMLHNEYKAILNLSNNNRNTTREHFNLWIKDFKECRKNIFFPKWTYCVWLGQNMHKGKYDEECKNQFFKLTEEFPDDPRVWRGLGCISSKLGFYLDALNYFKKANGLINIERNKRHKEMCEIEILYNIGMSHLNLEQYDKALHAFHDVMKLMKDKGQNNSNVIYYALTCLIKLKRPMNERIELLEDYIIDNPNEPELSNQLGLLYAANSDNNKALSCFARSYSMQNSIETFYYLLCRMVAMGKDLDTAEVFNVLDREEITMDDKYWKGAICFYIMGDHTKARGYYSQCDANSYIWYEDL